MRLFAEQHLTAVDIDYSQTNRAYFDEEFIALQNYLARQKWARKNVSGAMHQVSGGKEDSALSSSILHPLFSKKPSAITWVGFSLGSQRTLSFLLRHPESRPQLYVRMAGGWVDELGDKPPENETIDRNSNSAVSIPSASNHQLSSLTNTHFLLIHAEQDDIFSVSDARRLATLLKTNGVPVELHIFQNVPHWFGDDRDALMRCVAEYCARFLDTDFTDYRRFPDPLRLNVRRLYLHYWVPFALLCGFVLVREFLRWRKATLAIPRGNSGTVIVCLAWILGAAAILDTAFHLGLPRLQATDSRLNLAGRWLIEPKLKSDFDWLVRSLQKETKEHPSKAKNKRVTVGALLDNVELANYNRKLVNWKVDDDFYRRFVLSPMIENSRRSDETLLPELNWRRPLWESFYPRIRHESDADSAARIVVRFLRERVTIVPGTIEPCGIETIWETELTDSEGFEQIYVAALRSVGIPARLGLDGAAELFANGQWHPAPRPIISTLLNH
ncbi:MAG TPA: prolyl oligopeptidase family serine peptidase [Verrucomicrobiae bacterium]|nr:prolyl oligopeptidase family serine peptidase [Verrucomicrobiae bacterium]